MFFIILKEWHTKDFTAKMLCHVTRPDSVVMEVEVDAKANGEDCLNKVGCAGIHITFGHHHTFFVCFCKHRVMTRQCSSALIISRNFRFSIFRKLQLDRLLVTPGK